MSDFDNPVSENPPVEEEEAPVEGMEDDGEDFDDEDQPTQGL